jgi:hypothetical protein
MSAGRLSAAASPRFKISSDPIALAGVGHSVVEVVEGASVVEVRRVDGMACVAELLGESE